VFDSSHCSARRCDIRQASMPIEALAA